MKWRELIYFPRISCRVTVKTLSVAWIVQLLVIIPVLISSQFCFCFFIHLSHHMHTERQSDVLPNLKWLHIQLYESTYCLCYILNMVRDVSLTPNFAGISCQELFWLPVFSVSNVHCGAFRHGCYFQCIFRCISNVCMTLSTNSTF